MSRRARLVGSLTLALVAYNFFLNETFFRHNRQFMMVFLAGLSLMDSGRARFSGGLPLPMANAPNLAPRKPACLEMKPPLPGLTHTYGGRPLSIGPISLATAEPM